MTTPFKPNYPIRPGYHVLTIPKRANASATVVGSGVVMAFIDSGFYPHPAFADRVIGHIDATSSRVIEAFRHYHTPEWCSWHGQMTTFVAASADRIFPGVVPAVQLVLIKVSNRKKQIKEADILRGFDWLIANHRRYHIRVVNVSVGGDFESFDRLHPLHRAVQRLCDEGVVVCVAAGNSGQPHLVPPASAPAAITVGGVDDQNSLDIADWLPYHSNWGVAYDGTPKPEVIAPAHWIASPFLPGTPEARMARWLHPMIGAEPGQIAALLRAGYQDLGLPYNDAKRPSDTTLAQLQRLINKNKIIDADHQHVEGTSVAVAIVSGVVAQLLEVRPGLSVPEVRAILTGTASILPGIPRERQGGGLINPARAIEQLTATR